MYQDGSLVNIIVSTWFRNSSVTDLVQSIFSAIITTSSQVLTVKFIGFPIIRVGTIPVYKIPVIPLPTLVWTRILKVQITGLQIIRRYSTVP